MPYINKRRIGKPNHKEENTQRRNEKWGHYYGSKKWKLLRDYYKRLHPLCENCAIEGRSIPAEHVHHKCPFSWFDLESYAENVTRIYIRICLSRTILKKLIIIKRYTILRNH